jgi:hypothetical protein
MPDLPAQPNLDQLRHQAKDLLHAAQRGDSDAVARICAVSDRLILSSAQLALAREYGFASWARLKLEAERRDILLEMAAAAGDVTGWPLARFTHQSRLRALVFAADHQRLDVIDQLIQAGTPVNEADAEWGRLPLHTAAGNGRAASVRRLLSHGADPNLRDPRHHRTPLEECQPADSPERGEVEAILRPLTRYDTSTINPDPP